MGKEPLFKVYNKETKEFIANVIITPNGKVFSCSSIGDDIDVEQYFDEHRYYDDLYCDDITDKVELIYTNPS